jgi:hypothetical protein
MRNVAGDHRGSLDAGSPDTAPIKSAFPPACCCQPYRLRYLRSGTISLHQKMHRTFALYRVGRPIAASIVCVLDLRVMTPRSTEGPGGR